MAKPRLYGKPSALLRAPTNLLSDIDSLERLRLERSTPQPSPRPSWVKERLLSSLLANEVHAVDELAAISKVPLLLEGPYHSRIHRLLQSSRLQSFLSTRSTALLPLSCSPELYATGLFTPLSIVAKALIDATSAAHPARLSATFYAIHFFAGFHAAPADPLAGPVGLMRSLLVQLLHIVSTSIEHDFLRPLADELGRTNIAIGDLGALCGLFSALVQRLPDGTVLFCVIDGLGLFARDEAMERDMQVVVHMLHRCVTEMGWQAALKVVLTFCGGGSLLAGMEPALRLNGDEGEGEDDDDEEFEEDVEHSALEMVGADGGGDVTFEHAVGRYVISDEFD